jgi:RNA polymerase sigma factor (sigma-70 family)
LDLLRRSKEARTLSLDDEHHHVEAVSANTLQPSTEIRDWLRQALARLNSRSAEMFVLRFIEDYSNREIAGLMKTSPAVVAVVLHRTRARLKKEFKELARGRR